MTTEAGHEVAHGGPHAEHHAPSIDTLLWPAVNFLIFAALLVRALRGPLREYFRSRAEQIREALEAGARACREAQALKAELERDLADLPALRERLRADVRAAADEQRARRVEQGRRAAERIRADARLIAEHEVSAARTALRMDLIDEAVREATALVRGALGPEDQARFVNDFLQATRSPA